MAQGVRQRFQRQGCQRKRGERRERSLAIRRLRAAISLGRQAGVKLPRERALPQAGARPSGSVRHSRDASAGRRAPGPRLVELAGSRLAAGRSPATAWHFRCVSAQREGRASRGRNLRGGGDGTVANRCPRRSMSAVVGCSFHSVVVLALRNPGRAWRSYPSTRWGTCSPQELAEHTIRTSSSSQGQLPACNRVQDNPRLTFPPAHCTLLASAVCRRCFEHSAAFERVGRPGPRDKESPRMSLGGGMSFEMPWPRSSLEGLDHPCSILKVNSSNSLFIHMSDSHSPKFKSP